KLKMSGDAIHEAFVALEHLKWTCDPTHGKEGRMRSAEGGVGVGQAFPVGEPASTSDAQGIVCGAADGNGIGCALLVEPKRLSHSGCYCIGSLGGVIEAPGAHRCNV